MPLHLTKVAVGCRTLESLEKRTATRASGGEVRVVTRMRPKRMSELVGGNLYWIVKHRLVACQTIERYHVENCQILSESPPGSGLARAVRLAAWQFLVLPPRVNGKVMVGSWVRIRIDYNRVPASSASEGQEGG